MGKFFKGIVKITVAAAAVGGICYAFKDKIKESQVYKDYDMDNKIKKVKTTLKDKMPKIFDNEDDYIEDEDIFFDDLDLAAEDIDRDYVSINTDVSEENADTKTDSTSQESVPNETKVSTSPDIEVPTINI